MPKPKYFTLKKKTLSVVEADEKEWTGQSEQITSNAYFIEISLNVRM